MDPFMIACIILIAGAAFLIYEAFMPGGFCVIPGVVLLVLGIVGLIWPDILMSIWSPVIALVVAVPVTLITLKGYQYLAKPEPPTTTVAIGYRISRPGVSGERVSGMSPKTDVRAVMSTGATRSFPAWISNSLEKLIPSYLIRWK